MKLSAALRQAELIMDGTQVKETEIDREIVSLKSKLDLDIVC